MDEVLFYGFEIIADVVLVKLVTLVTFGVDVVVLLIGIDAPELDTGRGFILLGDVVPTEGFAAEVAFREVVFVVDNVVFVFEVVTFALGDNEVNVAFDNSLVGTVFDAVVVPVFGLAVPLEDAVVPVLVLVVPLEGAVVVPVLGLAVPLEDAVVVPVLVFVVPLEGAIVVPVLVFVVPLEGAIVVPVLGLVVPLEGAVVVPVLVLVVPLEGAVVVPVLVPAVPTLSKVVSEVLIASFSLLRDDNGPVPT